MMTATYNLRTIQQKDWKKLCFGDPLPSAKKEPVSTRAVLKDAYLIERIITKKYVPKEGTLYLVKWHGFPLTETTWEPHRHIDQESLNQYYPSDIASTRLMSVAIAFEDAIHERLRRGNRNNVAVIRFDHDIFRYCFQDDKTVSLHSIDDFTRLGLSENWYYRIDKNGTGQKIKFPMVLTPKLRMKKIYVQDQDKIIEKVKPVEIVHIMSSTCNY